MAIGLAKNIVRKITLAVSPAIALRRLRANNISINLYGQNIRKISDLKICVDRDNVLESIDAFGSKAIINSLKSRCINTVDITAPFYPEKIWSNELYDAIQNILLFTKKIGVYTNEQKETYYSIGKKFENFACSARTPKEKDLIVKILLDLEKIHDPGTAQHSQRTRDWAVIIGRQMQLNRNKIKALELAAYLHDFGKISISRDILNKQSKLTDDEYSQIKNHVLWGCGILKSCGLPDAILEIISNHHYIKGYPNIDTKKAPLLARILAIADSVEAATAGRLYEKGKTLMAVLKELRDPEGNYDQEVVDCFEQFAKKENRSI